MSRKRILFLMSRFLDGGIDTVLVDYLQRLSGNADYQLTLAVEQSMGELEVYAKHIPANVRVVHLVKSKMLMKWKKKKITTRIPLYAKVCDEAFLAPLRRYIISRELHRLAAVNDVIIDFDCCSYSYLKHIDVPKIAWFHFSFDEVLKQNRRRTLRIGKHLEHYDKVVTICKAMCDEGKRMFPQLVDKLCVIYNGKDREAILARAEEPVDDLRMNKPYILAVERLEESQKDISTLLRAYQLLREDYGHQESLYLLGKGQSEDELKSLAASLGIADKVVFLGFSSNPYPWMKNAKLLAHSAKLEGLPTVLLEGLMLDKLMVSTDCPTGPKEILDEGRAGLLVPVGDAPAMAEAIHTLLTSLPLQERISNHMAEHRKHFMYEETEKLFNKAINEVLKR